MAAISPVISFTVTPVISVTMPASAIQGVGITYQQFLNSVGPIKYGIASFYLWTQSYAQLSQPVMYTHTAPDGNSVTTYMPLNVDPYQSQPAKFFEADGSEIILDGFSTIQFPTLNQGNFILKLYCDVEYLSGDLDMFNQNNFEQVEQAEGTTFFQDYCNYIIDKTEA